MPRNYFRSLGTYGPEGNFAQRREWPSVGQTVLYAGKAVRVLKVVKCECAADIAGDSLPEGTGRVGLGWLLPNVCNTTWRRGIDQLPQEADSGRRVEVMNAEGFPEDWFFGQLFKATDQDRAGCWMVRCDDSSEWFLEHYEGWRFVGPNV